MPHKDSQGRVRASVWYPSLSTLIKDIIRDLNRVASLEGLTCGDAPSHGFYDKRGKFPTSFVRSILLRNKGHKTSWSRAMELAKLRPTRNYSNRKIHSWEAVVAIQRVSAELGYPKNYAPALKRYQKLHKKFHVSRNITAYMIYKTARTKSWTKAMRRLDFIPAEEHGGERTSSLVH